MPALLNRKACPLFIIFAVSFLLAGCGGGGSSGGGKEDPAVITINPSAVTVLPGGTVPFTAAVSGAPETAVTWRVEESGGGAIAPDGTYTAPQSEGTFHVTAATRSEPPKEATAKRGTQAASAVSVAIIPESITVGAGERYPFRSAVSGSADTAVTWRLEEGTAAGSVGPDGLYTAPITPGRYHLTAVSQADPNAQAVAAITVEKEPPPPPGEISVRISPKDPTIRVNERISFTATVTGTPNTEVAWTIQQGAVAGSITPAGEYTASGKFGEKKTFSASVVGSADTAVNWRVQEPGGGSVAAGGEYTAPNAAGKGSATAGTRKSAGTAGSSPSPRSPPWCRKTATRWRTSTFTIS